MNKRTNLLLESLKQADGGTVTCTFQTPDGPVQGTIAQSFFDEFTTPGSPLGAARALPPQRKLRIVQDNRDYLETQAEFQLRITGPHGLVIR